MLHIFSLENQDGVCSSWVFIIHTFCHGVAVMTPPLTLMIVVVSNLLDVLNVEIALHIAQVMYWHRLLVAL